MRIVRAILKRIGIDAFPRRTSYHYVPDYYGPAAPKMIDIRSLPHFGALAQTVIDQKRSLLYYDRLYVIYQALKRVVLVPGVAGSNMAEVGVYKGGGSYFIASTLAALGCDSIVLNCFDTFEGHAAQDVKNEDPLQRVSAFNDTSFESVKTYLSEFPNVRIFKGRIQETSHEVSGKQFSFIHLDMDLYEPTAYALRFFDERLLPGGIVVVDDYGFLTCPGVKQAVDEFVEKNVAYFGMHLLTGQYILTKR